MSAVIAILCLCLDGRPITAYGQNIKAITLLSPTIFLIVYAAILGKFLRRIGLFKAERSSTIGVCVILKILGIRVLTVLDPGAAYR